MKPTRDTVDAAPLSCGLPPVEAVDSLDSEALPGFLAGLAALQARAASRLAAHRIAAAFSATAEAPRTGRLLTVPEVAGRLGIPVQHAYALARGGLPAVRFGKYVRVRESDLEQWVSAHMNDGDGVRVRLLKRRQ